MDYKTAFLSQIKALPKFVAGTSLQRVDMLMHSVVSPHYLQQTPKIVITGSNGKGSTSMMVDSIMRQHGLTVGLFTSPHFLEFSERFKINGELPDYKQLFQVTEHVLQVATQIEHDLNEQFCFFDILFIIALAVFERNDAQMMVFEAGIGGRYDPVRLLKADLTALTSVSKEHTEILGPTEELIAYDKLDACISGGTTVVGRLPEGLLDKVKLYSQLRNVNIIDASEHAQVEGDSMRIRDFETAQISPKILGISQYSNMQTAIIVCKTWFGEQLPEQFLQNCIAGIEQCSVPGRFEKISTGPEIYIDAAHTNDAFEMLFDTIKNQFADKPAIFISGISTGRDKTVLAKRLSEAGAELIITQPHYRGEDAERLFVQCHTENPMYLETQVSQALTVAKQRAQELGARIFVVGSLFLAGEVTALEQGLPVELLYLH